ncbi:MAG: beta-glycosidase [Acidobacteria bacterium]|nr:beta-glycosidase [Acidobacteriota bacterium]
MPLSRRKFLKSSIIAASEIAAPMLPSVISSVSAAEVGPAPSTSSHEVPSAGYTRGIGVYPGSAEDIFSPTLRAGDSTYRNLALRRPATHSSSYDYNLTSQLITDGITATELPRWVAVSTNIDGPLPKTDREIILDHFPPMGIPLEGSPVSVVVQLAGGIAPPEVDTIAVCVILPDIIPSGGLNFRISASDDGRNWQQVGSAELPQGTSPENYPPSLLDTSKVFFPSIPLQQSSKSRYYQITCAFINSSFDSSFLRWQIGQVEFYRDRQRVEVGGPYSFTSAWMSAGSSEEWVSVDLGVACVFDRVVLHWIARAAEGSIQVSNDAHTWSDVHALTEQTSQVDDLRLAKPARARYVRVLMTRPTSSDGYILSELEVYGHGGLVAHPAPAPAAHADGGIDLAGGGWRVERSNIAASTGEVLSQAGYKDTTWLIATVPGTVLTSFYNAGAIPDPNFGQNQLYISDAYFCSDFWYRTEFATPPSAPNTLQWLNFDGINWKASIYLNGEKLGRIEGGFTAAQFNVTGKLLPGKANALAVLIEANATPGSTKQKTFESPGRNGGALGADNPTYHASIGWDWIPTIRGRNIGIWGNVSLTSTGAVTLRSPFVSSTLPLPDTSTADITIEADLVNHRAQEIPGTLNVRFGSIEIAHPTTVPASSTISLKLDPSQYSELHLQNPQLWWPTGYGDPHLYDVQIAFEAADHTVFDTTTFKAGIRQMTYSEDGGKLTMFINGRRFICRGGNWGFAESMLRYRAREYDAAVRYHREMNFTMIRNWVGQVGDEAFYDACDRNGIMVWQDFWLANPWDGPVPSDDPLFLANVRNLLQRIRNHASIGLYCGRNEGYPPKVLEEGIRNAIAELHPDIHYIPSSADDVVSGHGPYHALPPVDYFRIADSKLHSEIGMPNIPPLDSVRLMMPENVIWPQGLEWGLHDFCLNGAQGGKSFRSLIDDSYGGARNAEEWIALAQFLNYEGYRAMFESQSKYRAGLLLWMSHPCWPSFVWQTYDFYLDPTAAYFGCKKASEPLHIQWNRELETIEVVNYSAGDIAGLSVTAEIFNMNGTRMAHQTATVASKEDSVVTAFSMAYPAGLSSVHFLRLSLAQGSQLRSTNDYMRSLDEGDYRAIRQLAKAHVHASTTTKRASDLWQLTTEVQNTSAWPALMTHLKVVRTTSGDRILPAIYSDNYITLLPGDKRSIQTEVRHADTRGEAPTIVVEGFNIL